MAEWSNVPDSKSGVRYPRTVGSNPTLSASIQEKANPSGLAFLLSGAVLLLDQFDAPVLGAPLFDIVGRHGRSDATPLADSRLAGIR